VARPRHCVTQRLRRADPRTQLSQHTGRLHFRRSLPCARNAAHRIGAALWREACTATIATLSAILDHLGGPRLQIRRGERWS
jgi:hypothetical protein